MIPIRSRFSLRQGKKGVLLLEWNPRGRILNGLVFLIILAMILSGLYSTGGPSNLGLVILTLIVLPFLYNSAGNIRYRFSREEGSFSITQSFLGLPLKTKKMPTDAIRAVRLGAVEFEHAPHAPTSPGRMGEQAPKVPTSPRRPLREKPGLYHLQLIMDRGENITLESSTDRQELEACASALSSYLGVEF